MSLSFPLSPIGPPTEATQDLRVADLLIPGSNSWNIPFIRELLPQYEADIIKLLPSRRNAPDSWAWLPTLDGIYSVKSGYFEAQKAEEAFNPTESTNPQNQFNWKSTVWAVKSSSKTKLLLWKAAQNALPVGENLLHRRISDAVQCPRCGSEESVSHLFFHCPFAQRVWNLAPFEAGLNLETFNSIEDGLTAATHLTCLPPTGIGEGPLYPWLFWSIWSSRNRLIFSKIQSQPEEVILLAILRAKEWQVAQRSHLNHATPPAPPLQSHLPSTLATCFTDAAWKSDGQAGLGWLFKDQLGCTIREGSSSSPSVGSPLMAEALATYTAVKVAIESDLTQISFASDSLNLVKALNRKLHSKELHGILHDILDLSSLFRSVSFNFIPRNLNRQADALAKGALLLACTEH